MPQLTYVPRSALHLEKRLAAVKDNLCKLVAVTGSTKSGKTVLTTKVFPRDQAIWIDAGSVKVEEDLWSLVVDSIAGYTEVSAEASRSTEGTFSGSVSGHAGVPLVAKVEAEASGAMTHARGRSETRSRALAPRPAAIAQLRRTRTPLVIDDFHYLSRDVQGAVVRALKPLVFEGIPVVLIAIPHRRYDAVKVEREITGRIETIDVPSWSTEELHQIPQLGFPLLNVKVAPEVALRLAGEAYSSPHLMQEFCRELARENGIEETSKDPLPVGHVNDKLFREVAEGTGRVIYDKLSRGPRQRSDRMDRPLKAGGTADIYEVVLLGLAKVAPGLAKVEYETLRAAIREILADNIPQAHEVTRVLERMAEIAASDEASTPVLDWDTDEQKLHITDPFFAFFLKWAAHAAQQIAPPDAASRRG